MENQNPRVPPLWEHSLTTLLGHDPTSNPGIALRQWVHFQGVHNISDLLSWDQEELKAIPAQQVYSLDDHGQGLYLSTNQIKQMCGLTILAFVVQHLSCRHFSLFCIGFYGATSLLSFIPSWSLLSSFFSLPYWLLQHNVSLFFHSFLIC